MSRNGSGTYTLPAGNPVVTGTTISSTWANNTLSDIATALTGSLASDGQTTASGNLNMGTYKIINAGDPTNPQDLATKYYVDQLFSALGTMAYENANSVTITGGNGYGATAEAIIDARTGALRTVYYDINSQRQIVDETAGEIDYDVGSVTLKNINIKRTDIKPLYAKGIENDLIDFTVCFFEENTKKEGIVISPKKHTVCLEIGQKYSKEENRFTLISFRFLRLF